MIENSTIWIVIGLMACGSFLLRFSVMGAAGKRQMPEWLLRHLRYTAVAILPGLVAPLVLGDALHGGAPDMVRIAAALITLIVGWWRRNVLIAMIAGASTFFGLNGLLALF